MFGIKIYKKKDIDRVLDQIKHANYKAKYMKTSLDEMFKSSGADEHDLNFLNDLIGLRKGISWNLSNIEEILKR